MSAIGSASARGPEMWSDIAFPVAGLVGRLVEQRLQRGMLERVAGGGIVQHPLEGVVYPQGLSDLLHGASVIPLIRRRRLLCAEDERLHRLEIGQAVVALDVLEDGVEKGQRRPRRAEVLNVGVPGPVEARDEREPRVAVEEDEPRLVNRRDRHAVVAWPVPRRLLQIPKRRSNIFTLTSLDTEKQAELTRGPNHKARANRPRFRCRHTC